MHVDTKPVRRKLVVLLFVLVLASASGRALLPAAATAVLPAAATAVLPATANTVLPATASTVLPAAANSMLPATRPVLRSLCTVWRWLVWRRFANDGGPTDADDGPAVGHHQRPDQRRSLLPI